MSLFGLGGSSQKSKSEQESYGLDITQQALSPEQLAMQQQLYGQYMPMMNQSLVPGLNQATLANWRQAQSAYGNQAQRSARGAAQGAQGLGYMGGLFGTAGMQDLYGFAQQDNPYLQRQISGLAQDYGQMFREQLLPGIGSQFAGAGQRGSSRQGIAEGLAAQRVAQEFGQSATGLRAGAYGQQQQAATALAGLGSQQAMQGYGMAGDMFGQQAGQLYNNANLGWNLAPQFAQTNQALQLNPFAIGSQIVGQPSVLTQGIGMDYSKGTSKGSGSSLNLGFGGS